MLFCLLHQYGLLEAVFLFMSCRIQLLISVNHYFMQKIWGKYVYEVNESDGCCIEAMFNKLLSGGGWMPYRSLLFKR